MFQATVEVKAAVEPLWPVQVVLCKVMVQEGEFKNDLNFFAPVITLKTFKLLL